MRGEMPRPATGSEGHNAVPARDYDYGLDLAVDLGDADRVGPVHQAAAVAREAKAVEPHHIDVAGAVGLAFLEDLAGLVDRGEQQPAQDLLVREAPLRDP